MAKLTFVLGTRPEVTKLAPVILEAKRRKHQTRVVFTGQHRHIALPLLKFFGIEPDLDLKAMVPGQTLSGLSARVLAKLDQNEKRVQGDYLIVQGDTTSSFIAGYWAFTRKIPVAHVEAGLRTYDLGAPFPEEANRQLTARLASLHFAPTKDAVSALRKEGVSAAAIHQVGNTAIDALHFALALAESGGVPKSERIPPEVRTFVGSGNSLVLVTAHRRESFGRGFEGICDGILRIVKSDADVRVIYPVHPNPNVRKPVAKLLGRHPSILLCDPLPYLGFLQLMKRADVLLTDSGGVQEEGPSLHKPILVMREQTERPEGVKAGFAKLVGTDASKIHRECLKALKSGCRGRGQNPYGDGKTSKRILDALEKELKKGR